MFFIIDFDKTITNKDSTDELLRVYNKELLFQCQEKFRAGKINVREYLSTLMESLNLTKQEFYEEIGKNVEIDPYFKKFLEKKWDYRIVSAGTIDNINAILRYKQIEIPEKFIYSNYIEFKDRTLKVFYPYDKNNCFEGICKEDIILKYKKKYKPVIFIGDGVTDLSAAKYADILFAKVGLKLEKHCIENKIEHIKYNNFLDIINYITENQ